VITASHSQQAPSFEPVLEVSEYYDSPRSGVAPFNGMPHEFRSKYVDVDSSDDTTDVFELTPVGGSLSERRLANATFEVAPGAPQLPAGQLRQLVVSWHVIDDLRPIKSLERT
jgi:hypothetical protein